jgi:hypothetical protein
MSAVLFEQIISLSGLIALWAMWYFLWKPQRVDIFRQKLFAIRTELFDLAADGTVSFDHPAYTQLRLLINGLIRFAHRATFPTLLVASFQSKEVPPDAMIAWRKSVQKLPDDEQQKLLAIHARISETFAMHVIGGSLALCLFIALRVAFSVAKALFFLAMGKKDIHAFSVDQARLKVNLERNQVTQTGAKVIEARVLHEEQRRLGIGPRHAFAH